jgi:CIC family chloride channel protein
LRYRDRILRFLDVRAAGKWILLGAIVGVAAGLGAVAFHQVLGWISHWLINDLANYYPPQAAGEGAVPPPDAGPSHRWILFALPILGGLVSGWLVFRFAPEAEGHGTDALIRSFHRLRGHIRKRIPPIKAVASIITIGTGGSAGREGPIAQIGAGIASTLGSWFHFSMRDRRLMLLAGAAGGIGAIFRAPLGAALFTTEVLYRNVDLEFEAIIPSIISSIVAYSVFVTFYPDIEKLFVIPSLGFHNPAELPIYAVMALYLAAAGFLYVRFFYGARDRFFHRIPIPNHFKPALGGLLLSCLVLFAPQVLAQGYGWVQNAIDGKLAIGTMFLLAMGKVLATTFTISSGGSGGVFGPSIYMGAMLGGAYGFLVHQWFPGIVEQPASYVLVGMAGFFAGVAKVPIAALIMVCEMTGGYDLIVPLMLVCVIAFLFSRNWTLYEEQVSTLLDSPAHLGDFVKDILAEMTVGEILVRDRVPEAIPESMPLNEVLARVRDSRAEVFPVVDYKGRLRGVFTLGDLRNVFGEEGADDLIIARDIAAEQILTVTPEDDLNRALRALTHRNVDEVPVVDSTRGRELIGMLSRRDLIAAYDERVRSLKGN